MEWCVKAARLINRFSEKRDLGVSLLSNLFLPDLGFFFILSKSPDILMEFGFFLSSNLSDSGDLEQYIRQICPSFFFFKSMIQF